MTERGAFSSTAKEASRSGSVSRWARPFARRVVPEPGIRNRSAARPSRTMLRSESTRLLPRRSGSMSVRSSAMRTKPGRSPRGRAVQPLRAAGGQDEKGRGLDELPVVGRDPVHLLDAGGLGGLAVEGFEFLDAADDGHGTIPRGAGTDGEVEMDQPAVGIGGKPIAEHLILGEGCLVEPGHDRSRDLSALPQVESDTAGRCRAQLGDGPADTLPQRTVALEKTFDLVATPPDRSSPARIRVPCRRELQLQQVLDDGVETVLQLELELLPQALDLLGQKLPVERHIGAYLGCGAQSFGLVAGPGQEVRIVKGAGVRHGCGSIAFPARRRRVSSFRPARSRRAR